MIKIYKCHAVMFHINLFFKFKGEFFKCDQILIRLQLAFSAFYVIISNSVTFPFWDIEVKSLLLWCFDKKIIQVFTGDILILKKLKKFSFFFPFSIIQCNTYYCVVMVMWFLKFFTFSVKHLIGTFSITVYFNITKSGYVNLFNELPDEK